MTLQMKKNWLQIGVGVQYALVLETNTPQINILKKNWLQIKRIKNIQNKTCYYVTLVLNLSHTTTMFDGF